MSAPEVPIREDERLTMIIRGLVGDRRRLYLRNATFFHVINTTARWALHVADHWTNPSAQRRPPMSGDRSANPPVPLPAERHSFVNQEAPDER